MRQQLARICIIFLIGLAPTGFADELYPSPGVQLVEEMRADRPHFESFLTEFLDEETGVYLFPKELIWLSGFNLANDDVEEMISIRTTFGNFRYFEDVLKRVAALPSNSRNTIAQLDGRAGSLDEAGLAEYGQLLYEIRVPVELRNAIMTEVISNGATARYQKGIANYIDQIAENNSVERKRIDVIVKYAPQHALLLPVIVYNTQLDAERVRLDAERVRLDAKRAALDRITKSIDEAIELLSPPSD